MAIRAFQFDLVYQNARTSVHEFVSWRLPLEAISHSPKPSYAAPFKSSNL